jgi:hypothetical protein
MWYALLYTSLRARVPADFKHHTSTMNAPEDVQSSDYLLGWRMNLQDSKCVRVLY